MDLDDVKEVFTKEAPDNTLFLDNYVAFMVVGILLLLLAAFLPNIFHSHPGKINLFGISGQAIIGFNNPLQLGLVALGAFMVLYSGKLMANRVAEVRGEISGG